MSSARPECLHLLAQAWLHQAFLQGLTGPDLARLRLTLRGMCVAETLCVHCYAELHPGKSWDAHRTFLVKEIKRYAE